MITIPCAPASVPSKPRTLEALAAFGLPQDLPQTTHGQTTLTPPVVLPAKFTHTLRVYRALKGCTK